VPAASGEPLRDDDVEAVIRCLRRPPPIAYGDVLHLPLSWREHARNLDSFEWLSKLWDQSKRDRAREGATVPIDANPTDLLALCMYTKLASVAMRTTDTALEVLRLNVAAVPGAADAGLLEVFGGDGVAAPSLLAFIEPFLAGDDAPWRLSARGGRAADAARGVLDRVYGHTRRVAQVLKQADIASLLRDTADGDDGGGVLVVDSGPHGHMGAILNGRVPASASSTDGAFRVEFAPSAAWPDDLNAAFRATVALLADGAAPARAPALLARLGAFTALSSSHLLVSTYAQLQSASSSVITYPRGAAAHVARELTIGDTALHVDRMLACAAVQPGVAAACTYCTFCGGTARALAAANVDTSDLADYDIASAQASVEAVARALDTPAAPLGTLRGTLGGVVEAEGGSRRLAFWRSGADEHDSVVTLLPKRYVDILFADYMTGYERFARTLQNCTFLHIPAHIPHARQSARPRSLR
jgi:hypothetical protein